MSSKTFNYSKVKDCIQNLYDEKAVEIFDNGFQYGSILYSLKYRKENIMDFVVNSNMLPLISELADSFNYDTCLMSSININGTSNVELRKR